MSEPRATVQPHDHVTTNASRRDRDSKFFQAAREGDAETVCRLLDEGAVSANRTDVDNYTALHRCFDLPAKAPWAKLEAVARLLVERGADVNASQPGLDGWTPLHLASYGGHVEGVKLLLELGSSAECLDWYGKRPIDWARVENHPETQRVLSAATKGERDLEAEPYPALGKMSKL